MIQAFLCERWESMLGEARPRSVRVLKLAARPGRQSSVSLLVFADGRRTPSLLVKINRDPGYADAILAEHRNISEIYGRLQGCRSSVPRPLGCWQVDGHAVLCETVVRGNPFGSRTFLLAEAAKRERVSRFISVALEWLASFHAETGQSHVVVDGAFMRDNFHVPVADFLQRHRSAVGGWESTLRELPRTVEKYVGTALPVGAVHGDFTHANILIHERGIGVVDWEDCAARGLPFRDVFFLVCQLALNFDGRRPGPESLRSFFLSEWGAGVVTGAFREYAQRRGFDAGWFALMLPQFIASLLVNPIAAHRDPATYLFASPECLVTALDFSRREHA
jgi:aminoglycoside phosphotransferase (APT) family kinase protein